MNTTTESIPLDRAVAEAVIYRVALSAFTYFPGREDREPGYSLAEDVDWCLAPIPAADRIRVRGLRAQAEHVITHPDADRQAFMLAILDLTS
ncbi:hypothetical protein [Microbacterium sp. SCN 69-37]|uniref:hypothetical protein n=1 Tax=Microbacterium sp. SCN 69-37 TaxID=1660115 RepID=UPI00086A4B24|nr:hypothetical protein [Microbacterium sp. SCN 69-37]ODT25797.1 MAG: hypothetical protein ABS64_00840 [Microbacterium sp. SCN 69-37]